MSPELLNALLDGSPVASDRLEEAFHALLSGEVEDVKAAALLVALRARPTRATDLAALARALRAHRRAVRPQVRPLIDTCGTGGDGTSTFNISTAAAFVVAAAGGAVAKHGNRSVSSKCGSADVLETLGYRLETPPEEAERLLDATGFAFLFAPRFHPAIARVMPVRKALGIRTHFNLVGPLANPALAEHQVLGVARAELVRPMAEALHELGTRRSLVVHCAGLDELGLHGTSEGMLVSEEGLEPFSCTPESVGLTPAPLDALAGGGPEENASIVRRILGGEAGAPLEVVALNAGAALFVAGLAPSLKDAVELARTRVLDGAAARGLERAIASSQRVGAPA